MDTRKEKFYLSLKDETSLEDLKDLPNFFDISSFNNNESAKEIKKEDTKDKEVPFCFDISKMGKKDNEQSGIYLDYAATTPVLPEILSEMIPYFSIKFGNPSSIHTYGNIALQAINKSRAQVASFLKCEDEEIIFTSGATESLYLAIKGIAFGNLFKGNHIITSSLEHPATLQCFKELESYFDVSYIPVDDEGTIDTKALASFIRPSTILISIMMANNEIGTIQNLAALSSLSKSINSNIYFHTDASQAISKVKMNIHKDGIDALTMAGHKFGCPKGVGVLYIRKNILMNWQVIGAGQENKRRGGTENVPYIVAIGKGCEMAERDLNKNITHYKECRSLLLSSLIDNIKIMLDKIKKDRVYSMNNLLRVNGNPNSCLPNILSISFHNINAYLVLYNLRKSLAASAGAACHSAIVSLSSTLLAIHMDPEWGNGTIRLSIGIDSSIEDMKKGAFLLAKEIVSQWKENIFE